MKNERLLDVLGQIDEELIEEANPEKIESNIKKTNSYSWMKWAGMAACFVIVAGAVVPVYMSKKQAVEVADEAGVMEELQYETEEEKPEVSESVDTTSEVTTDKEVEAYTEEATDNEPIQELSIEKARDIELFPTEILEGYVLEDSVAIYDKKVLVAKFYNETLEDELIIRIADKEWFYTQNDDVEFNAILYEADSSFIYFEGEEKIIQYTFSSTDIAQHEDFFDMVYSAEYFKQNAELPEIKEG